MKVDTTIPPRLEEMVYILESSKSVLSIAIVHKSDIADVLAFYPDGTFYVLGIDKMWHWHLNENGGFIFDDGYNQWTDSKQCDKFIDNAFYTWIIETVVLG